MSPAAQRKQDATHCIMEDHGGHLVADPDSPHEHAECTLCGREWLVTGDHADIIADGDGYCDPDPLADAGYPDRWED